MNILALDLGTHGGWATVVNGEIKIGSQSFSGKPTEGRGQRWIKFRTMLNEIVEHGDIAMVYFEDIKMHKGVIAAHIYGGFLAHLETWCELRNIPFKGVGFGIIKKSFTGKGNAKKDVMIAEAQRRGFKPANDDEADALAILLLAIEMEKK